MSTRRTGRERHSRLTSTWPDTVAVQARLTGARLRDAWGNLLSRFLWQWFVTLTFDPTRVFPVSSAVVEREAIWWGGMVARMLRLPMGWVCAPERGRGGLCHGHMLLTGLPQGVSPAPALPVWQARNGRIDLRPVENQAGIALYTTKEAAEAGTIVLSDTLTQYQPCAADTKVVVPLYPGDRPHGGTQNSDD